MTLERIIELLEIEHQCILRNTNGNCDRQCGECDLVQDDSELHEMYTDVTAFLKMQAPRVLSLKTPAEWHDNVIWLEIKGKKPTPCLLRDCRDRMMFGHYERLMYFDVVGSYRESGYMLKNYDVKWRCWTARPSQEEMEAMPWNGSR